MIKKEGEADLAAGSSIVEDSGHGYNIPFLNLLNKEEIIEELEKELPDYMVPDILMPMDHFPLTINGKLDKRSLPNPHFSSTSAYVAPVTETEKILCNVYAEVLGISTSKISIHQSFFEMGGNSILTIQLKNRLGRIDGFADIGVADLFKFDTIDKLIKRSDKENQTKYHLQESALRTNSHEIAVVGLSGTFGSASSAEELWQLIVNKKEGIKRYSLADCRAIGIDEAILNDPDFIPVASLVDEIESFDPSFWGISPGEAGILNPQIRKFIEHCWFTLESAGYITRRRDLQIGVFAGCGENDYLQEHILKGSGSEHVNRWEAATANIKDAIATKTAYFLDLSGPANAINTACSTGLVTIIEACKNLLLGTCNMALAGGASLSMPYNIGYKYQEGMILSSDGHCRTFDHTSSGTVSGSGVAVVLLKRLEDAIKDGDRIFGVIKGYATNNDGSRKTAYTAPSVIGQSECIINAQQMAGVEPFEIDYVECHGTATRLGDPIEIKALREAFEYRLSSNKSDQEYHTAIGSVKANIGHTDTVAGTAGLIKLCYMMMNNIIPAQVNFEQANPELRLNETHFHILKENYPWHSVGDRQRIAAVSSFGIGGTNAHVILGDYPSIERRETEKIISRKAEDDARYIFPISAKSRQSLELYKEKLKEYIERIQKLDGLRTIRDIAFTLQEKKELFDFRASYSASTTEELISKLGNDTFYMQCGDWRDNKIIFMFPGQGAQFKGMARKLYENEPFFRNQVDRCIEFANQYLSADLRAVLYADGEDFDYDINEIQWSAISLFTIEYSLARFLEHIGIRPDAFIGHSFGEYVAATLSGVFKLEDAIRIVVTRGKLMQLMEPGSMLAITEGIEVVSELIERHNCEIAVINSSEDVVASGKAEDIENLKVALEEKHINVVKVTGSVAGHSRLMDGAVNLFEEAFQNVVFEKPTGIFISNLTGKIAGEEVMKASYWSSQLRKTVHFGRGIMSLNEHYKGRVTYVELGPGKGLSYFVNKCKRNYVSRQIQTVQLLIGRKEFESANYKPVQELSFKEDFKARLWASGTFGKLNDSKLFESASMVLDLPLYQFNLQKCWLDKGVMKERHQINPIDQIFYERTWMRSGPMPNFELEVNKENADVLVLIHGQINQDDYCNSLLNLFIRRFDNLKYAIHSSGSSQWNEHKLDFGDGVAFSQFLETVCNYNSIDKIIYLSSVTDLYDPALDAIAVQNIFDWAAQRGRRINQFVSVSVDGYDITGQELLPSVPSLVYGVTKSISHEYFASETKAFHVDVASCDERFQDYFLGAIFQNQANDLLVLRGRYAWLPMYRARKISSQNSIERLRVSNDTTNVLITGGLGGLGNVFAEDLVKESVYHNVIIIGRTAEIDLPESKKTKLSRLRETAHRIHYWQIDITDTGASDQIQCLLKQAGIHKLDIVLHAAVVYAKTVTKGKTASEIRSVICTKAGGINTLIHMAEQVPVNYLISCSSLASIFPSLGNMDYTAANVYLDEISVREHSGIESMLSVGINQVADSDIVVAMATSKADGRDMAENTIRQADFPNIVKTLIAEGIKGHIILSRYDIEKLISDTERTMPAIRLSNELGDAVKVLEAHSTPLENEIIQIVGKVLGLKEISLRDDFLRIGGNSLLAIQVINLIKKRFFIELSIKDIFQNTDISLLAGVVQEKVNSANLTTHIAETDSTYARTIVFEKEILYETLKSQTYRYMDYKAGTYRPSNLLVQKELVDVDLGALYKAIDAFVSRHESLRTLFLDMENEVWQKIIPVDMQMTNFTVEDIRGIPERAELIKTKMDEYYNYLFDFQKEASFKCRLIQYEDNKSLFMLVIDHMIYDHHAMKIIENEPFVIYEALRKGGSNPLTPLKFQFKDYVAHHNQHFRGEKLLYHQNYFDNVFKDLPAKPVFKDRNRGSDKIVLQGIDPIGRNEATHKAEGMAYIFIIRADLLDQIHSSATEMGVSFFNFILAAYAVFLGRISDQHEFIIESPMSTRVNDDFSKIIGWLTGILLSRVKVREELSFRELVSICKNDMLEALEHIYYHTYEPHINVAWNDLATQLNIINDKNTASGLIDDFESQHFELVNIYFDISFNIRVLTNGISICCTYKTDLIAPSAISDVCQSFVNILKLATNEPDLKIGLWESIRNEIVS
ncbi:type I polyketide synthase [Mucilaginibacter oryzae]|uniref:type I polyketide synthase n=1 Tax=Mucilaginibacter oryzae TaxID=468058 RepID=UPI001B869109|nr:type I polyketide synthase [Mucilaginibacter oryzae]